jgi:hypothetical protein
MWTVERIALPTRPNDHVTEPTLVSDWSAAYELLANLTTRAEALGPGSLILGGDSRVPYSTFSVSESGTSRCG